MQLNVCEGRVLCVVTTSLQDGTHTDDAPQEVSSGSLIRRCLRESKTTTTVTPADTRTGRESSTELVRCYEGLERGRRLLQTRIKVNRGQVDRLQH